MARSALPLTARASEGVAKAMRAKALFSAAIALLYGASPIDLIPDVIPVLGWLDDALIVPALLTLAFFQFRKAKKMRPVLTR